MPPEKRVFLLFSNNILIDVYETQEDAATFARTSIRNRIEEKLGHGGMAGWGGTIKIEAIEYKIQARVVIPTTTGK